MPHTPRNIQSPYVAADFWTQWESETPRMGLFVKVTSKESFGSEVLGFTTCSRSMTLPGHPGVTFRPSSALTPTVIEQGLDEPSSLELTGVYESSGFDHDECINGKWNFASIEVFSACWDNTNLGELLHFKGNTGEFKDRGTYFIAECRGLISRLSNDVSPATSRFCRVKQFGDAECGRSIDSPVTIDGNEYEVHSTGVTQWSGVAAQGTVYADLSYWTTPSVPLNIPPDDFYANGTITFESGPNAGISREIASSRLLPGQHIKLYLKRLLPFVHSGGDTFSLIAGCNRTLDDCIKFDNVINRRAEDYVPGIESINRLPTVS